MVRFDDSLPTFASLITQHLGPDALRDNLFLRDISGKLTFILLTLSPADDKKALLMLQAEQELGAYVDKDGFCVSTPEQLFDDSLKTLDSARQVSILHPKFDGQVWLVDRRFVGADWLRPVELPAKGPARFVFASMKGGVGRSTALCVLASHLASSGQRVLCIDLDMESPGLGNMLLTPEDGNDQVTPRSFLKLFNVAAAFPDLPNGIVLSPAAIRNGLREASKVRLDQLDLEYRWVKRALAPLSGLQVPSKPSEVYRRWNASKTMERIMTAATDPHDPFLPPFPARSSGDQHERLANQMKIIGVIAFREDGRIDMPDLFRVAARMLKKGGVSLSESV